MIQVVRYLDIHDFYKFIKLFQKMRNDMDYVLLISCHWSLRTPPEISEN